MVCECGRSMQIRRGPPKKMPKGDRLIVEIYWRCGCGRQIYYGYDIHPGEGAKPIDGGRDAG